MNFGVWLSSDPTMSWVTLWRWSISGSGLHVQNILYVSYQQSSEIVGGAEWDEAWMWPNAEMIKLWFKPEKSKNEWVDF